MKIKTIIVLIPLLLSILLSILLLDDNRSLSAEASSQKRIRFHIVAVEENPNERNVLSQTTIEGLPETDFNINLQTASFKMQAQFLSDLVGTDKLRIKARLDTRRFYGYSPTNLPLYEEDAQKHALLLDLDETIVLLPFGRGSDETLKIEITPTLLSDVRFEASDALKINIDKPIPSGEIAVEAFNNPHHFEVEAILLADGREIARGVNEVLFDEEQEIALLPNANADTEIAGRPLTARLTVNKYTRNRPQDMVGIGYKIYRAKTQMNNQNQAEIFNGLGFAALGGDLVYQLDKSHFSDGKKYELKFNIRLAASERKSK